MKTISLLLAVSICGFRLASADVVGSGHVVSETRNVSGFHGVELKGSGDVAVTQGDSEGLVIEAEDNLLPLIESNVDADGVLHLGFKNHLGSVKTNDKISYKLSVKTLDKLEVAGSGSIHAPQLAAGHASVEIDGSGSVLLDDLRADDVKTAVDGSGTVKLAGIAHAQTVAINGSGTYEGKELKTADATVEINGSGESLVAASGALTVAINGSGEVGYAGSPAVTKSIHGSGAVHPLGVKNAD